YVYAKREKKSFSSVFATIVVERFIDVLTLFALFGIAFIIHRQKIVSVLPSNIQPDKLIFLVALMMAVVIFSFYPPFVEFMLSKLIKPFSTKLYDRARDIFVKFRKGFAIIKNPSQYLRLMLESISIWICYALPMYFIFFAFNFQSEIQLGIADALLLMVVIGVGVTIAPTPGAIGIYHGLVVAAMTSLYGISQEKALAYATVTHGINFLVQIVFGGLFFLRENISKIPTNTSEIPSELEEETQVKPN
ncbi:MAG: lysylphosphatidylglycerol synthase transmembrane domain-containing protein, partial [Bacteroidota bacterium]